MNEHGFFTVVGLCLLLVISLAIRAIQDTEKNYSYLASDFQEELELQGVAESGLIEAVKGIRNGDITVEPPNDVEYIQSRRYWQRQISVNQPSSSDRFKNISVEVYGERGTISMYTRNYSAEDDYTGTYSPYRDTPYKKTFHTESGDVTKQAWDGVVLISVASGETNSGIKKFRRALAYILDDDDEKILHFMTDAERGKLRTN